MVDRFERRESWAVTVRGQRSDKRARSHRHWHVKDTAPAVGVQPECTCNGKYGWSSTSACLQVAGADRNNVTLATRAQTVPREWELKARS